MTRVIGVDVLVALNQVLRHCAQCDDGRRHTVTFQDVPCAKHLHRVNHYICVECGSDIQEPVGRREPDCVV